MWVYFNIDPHAAAVRDAFAFARAVRRFGLPTGRVRKPGSSDYGAHAAG
jgi:hypothetical protein